VTRRELCGQSVYEPPDNKTPLKASWGQSKCGNEDCSLCSSCRHLAKPMMVSLLSI